MRSSSLCLRLLTLGLCLLLALPAQADEPPAKGDASGSPDGPAPEAKAEEPKAKADELPDGPLPPDAPLPPEAPAEEPAPAAVADDTLIHKNGSLWTGRIIHETAEKLVLERVSKTGGVGRITFQRKDIKTIRRGRPEGVPSGDGGPRLVREEWFLLRSTGGIIGTRQLELWSVKSRGKPGYRLEEHIEYFAQGPQLPATRTHRTEEVDERFVPRLIAYREEGDASSLRDGPSRYARNVSGRVVKGVWRGSSYRGGSAHQCEVELAIGTRGPLGTREYLLRLPRRVGLLDLRVIDPDREEVVAVRAGFASVTQDPSGRRPGHEFHWEQGGRRFISYFDRTQNVVQERIAEGVLAVPVSKEQASAATTQANASGTQEGGRDVTLVEPGIAFTPPGPLWSWKARDLSPKGNAEGTSLAAGGGWRVLGRMNNEVLVTDMRVEWHPKASLAGSTSAATEAWLLRRLRAVSPDLAIVAERRELTGLHGAWRLGLQGTLRKESVRTVAVVVDRPGGRVVLLLAGPAGAWEQVRPAIARLVRSIRLL